VEAPPVETFPEIEIPPPKSASPEMAAEFERLAKHVRGLMEIAGKYSIDVGPSGQALTRATHLWVLEQGEQAYSLMKNAVDQLSNALEADCKSRLDAMKKNADRLGPFAPPGMSTKLSLLDVSLARKDFRLLLSEMGDIAKEMAQCEKDLGITGKLVFTLNSLDTGITSMGGTSPSSASLIEKAYDAYSGGRAKEAEAILGIAVGEAMEVLSPLLVARLSTMSLMLKQAHDKGSDVRDAAVLMKHAVFALRSRNFLQVLSILPKLESDLEEGLTSKPAYEPVAPAPAEERPVRKAQVHSRITSTAVQSTEPSSSAPAPSVDRPPIKKGCSYLVFESKPRESLQVFLEGKGNKKGLILTTTFPPKLTEDNTFPDTELAWISDTGGFEETLHPKTLDHEISARILDFLRSSNPGALAIDGLSYIISSNGFPRVEKFLKTILDVASAKKVTVVATLASESVDESSVAKLRGMFDYSF
jgi:hypothetical protein